jgi:hypothetical protein
MFDQSTTAKMLAEGERAIAEAEGVKQLSAEYGRAAQQNIDFIKPLCDAARSGACDDATAAEAARMFKLVADTSQSISDQMVVGLRIYNMGTSGITNTAVNAFPSNILLKYPSGSTQYVAIERATEQISGAVKRAGIADILERHLLRFGLDRAGAGMTPALLYLHQARRSLEVPATVSTSGIAVLVAMRSCIDAVFAEFRNRLQGPQQTGKKWAQKVKHYADHARFPGTEDWYFQVLITQCEGLNDSLSEAKGRAVSREEIAHTFDRAVAFLNALLDGLDESKFRPPT